MDFVCLRCMAEFIQNSSDYMLLLGASSYFLGHENCSHFNENEEHDQSDDGGISGPVLDLPPGVSLPALSPKEKSEILV